MSFDPKISLVRNARDTACTDTLLSNALADISNGKYKAQIEAVRTAYATGGKKAADTIKRELPGLIVAGTFTERKNSALVQSSFLICADVDNLGDRFEDCRELLLKDPHVVALFTSPTGTGLKLIFCYNEGWSHLKAYGAAERLVLGLCGEAIDPACKDVARLCFISHDPDLLFNPAAVELPESDAPVEFVAPTSPLPVRVGDVTPGDDYDTRADIPTLLKSHGWSHVGGKNWRRPEKKDGVSATWNHVPERFYVFTSSTQFEANRLYKPWHVFAILECRGDFKRAASELRRLEFGSVRTLSMSTPSTPVAGSGSEVAEGGKPSRFPALETEPDEADILAPGPVIITGILEAGDKMVIGGGSKSYKTWTLIDLGLAIANGASWWGRSTNKTPVLYCNFEIKPKNFWKRFFTIRRARGFGKNDAFRVWHLRGKGFTMDDHRLELVEMSKSIGSGVIILDPIYKLYGDRNENSVGDMSTLFDLFDKVATETGCSIVYGAHFAKGSTANKDAMERISGSGGFQRDPDAILTITRLDEKEGANTFQVAATLRDMQPIDNFGVRWEYPLMVPTEGMNVRNLHDPSKMKMKWSIDQVVDLLRAKPLTSTEWQRASNEMLGMSKTAFHETYRIPAQKQARFVGGLWTV